MPYLFSVNFFHNFQWNKIFLNNKDTKMHHCFQFRHKQLLYKLTHTQKLIQFYKKKTTTQTYLFILVFYNKKENKGQIKNFFFCKNCWHHFWVWSLQNKFMVWIMVTLTWPSFIIFSYYNRKEGNNFFVWKMRKLSFWISFIYIFGEYGTFHTWLGWFWTEASCAVK